MKYFIIQKMEKLLTARINGKDLLMKVVFERGGCVEFL